MKPIAYIPFLLCVWIVTSDGLLAQHGFNELYDLEALEITYNVSHKDEYTYASGAIGYANGDYKSFLVKIDPKGALVWEKRYRLNGDTMSTMGGLIVTESNLITQIGILRENGGFRHYFHQRNLMGDSINTVFYDTVDSIVLFGLAEDTLYGGFWATGYQYDIPANDRDALLLRLGSNGEYLWHRTFDTGMREVGIEIATHPEGGAVVSGYISDGGDDTDTWLFHADSANGIIWEKNLNLSDLEDGGGEVIISTDGFIYLGTKHTYEQTTHGYMPRKVFLGKYDLDGQEVWTREFGRLDNSGPYFGIRELDNGDIIGITNGFYAIPENLTVSLITWALKITPEGDSVWDKYYRSGPWDSGSLTHYSWTIDACEDDGFVSAGFTQGSGQDLWVVKFDSNGCYDTITDCVIGIEERYAVAHQMNVWPNPAHQVLHVETNSKIYALEVLDLTGRITISLPLSDIGHVSVDVSFLPNGIYVLQAKTDTGIQTTRFVKRQE